MSFVYDTYVIWHREMMRYKRNVRYVIAQVFFPYFINIPRPYRYYNRIFRNTFLQIFYYLVISIQV